MNKESKIIPINSTTDAFRNQMALFLQRMLDVNEWILSFPPIKGNKGIDDMKCLRILVITVFILIGAYIWNISYTETTVIDGIRYKISVNGSSANAFPTNDTAHAYTVSVSCDNSEAFWDYANWKLKLKNTSAGTDKCSIAFNDVTNDDYINNFINTNKGTTQGATSAKGQLVNEKGVRYEGTDPYNYVSFNGELWRIIGMFAFDKSTNVEVNGGSTDCSTYNCYTKIIRNDSIGSYAFSALGTSTSAVYNYWEKTDGTKGTLNKLLNTYSIVLSILIVFLTGSTV